MYGHVARQPIFDKNLNLYGYELLFRDGALSFPADVSGDTATSELLSSTFLTSDIYTYTGVKKAFVNFTRNHLVNRIPLLFPREITVVEILEDVSPEAEVVAACREIAQKGFTIALDDFVYRAELKPLIALSQIVKIDFRNTSPERISAYFNLLNRDKKRMLAEKVETYEEFKRGRDMGFQYFQGYFFARPQIISQRKTPVNLSTVVRLVSELQKPDITVDEVEEIMQTDANLSFKMLRFVNSASVPTSRKIDSLKQATTLMGITRIRSMASMMLLTGIDENKPLELTNLAMIRGKMCELLATHLGLIRPDRFYTLGLLSVLDAMLDKPMEQVVPLMPLANDMNDGLLHRSGELGRVLKCVLAYELGELSPPVGLTSAQVQSAYQASLRWVSQ